MRRAEGRLPGVLGELFWQAWLPESATGIVLVSHGLGEHSGRYSHVAEALVEDGWAVYALDHAGHGRSEGRRVDGGHANWVPDLDLLRLHAAARHPGLPVFLVGHSMGGHIALAYALEHQADLAGLVLSAPGLSKQAVPAPVVPVLLALGRLLPTLRPAGIDLADISRDPAVVAAVRADPLCYSGNPTLRLGAAMFGAMDDLLARSRELTLPVLLQHGEIDAITTVEVTRTLARTIASDDLTVEIYPGLWHEIYNEPERDRPIGDLRTWLGAHRESVRPA
ncbi:alpha/beta hydrolase [Pseudonocardia oroxyli]|uniref:Lysophospholipase, alpha-beta hydrolase superfamily n=1 Tax=Pseudonocardia oroxyli TaxID=366584 RepID=A0A1G7RFB1_PSEOR|nr:alpha/beta hydrolase [Pseudonocardia oroxyli]SDG09467.1 Lysophospholipase, alpha-beta hydrolase superfamily [Pseudonocardia oroxyli]